MRQFIALFRKSSFAMFFGEPYVLLENTTPMCVREVVFRAELFRLSLNCPFLLLDLVQKLKKTLQSSSYAPLFALCL